MKILNKILILSIAVIFASCGVDSSKKYVLSPQQTIQAVTSGQDIISPECLADIVLMKPEKYRLIDLRNPHDFLIDHVEGSINIPAKDLFDNKYYDIINQDKVINVLYGNSVEEVVSYYLLLKQLNYKNIKISLGNYKFIKDNIIDSYGILSGHYYDENPKYDYAKIISEISGSGSSSSAPAPKKKKAVVKRKKKEVTGGCG